jgi:putative transposase
VVRVRGAGGGRVSIAGVACYRPGDRPHLFYQLRAYRRRKGEAKGFTWADYRDLIIAAHHHLSAPMVWVWDKCAVRRFVASPSQSGGIWRNIPGSPGLPGGES